MKKIGRAMIIQLRTLPRSTASWLSEDTETYTDRANFAVSHFIRRFAFTPQRYSADGALGVKKENGTE